MLTGEKIAIIINCFCTQIPNMNSALAASSAVLYTNDCKLAPTNWVYLDNLGKLWNSLRHYMYLCPRYGIVLKIIIFINHFEI